MALSKVDVIIHPQRLRILETLFADQLTTQEIATNCPICPESSIYRHLKILLGAGVVEVADTRPVKGVEEKVYRLPRLPHLSPADLAGLDADAHQRYFTTYVVTLLHDFRDYLDAAPPLDFLRDLAGYSEAIFYADRRGVCTGYSGRHGALQPLLAHGPGAGRMRRKSPPSPTPLRPRFAGGRGARGYSSG